MKKILYIDKAKVNHELAELANLRDKTNRIFELLWEFGISEPEAIKSPIDAVHTKFKESIQSRSEFSVKPEKVAELIGKEQEYSELIKLAAFVVEHRHFNLIRFNKTKFSIIGNAEKQLTEEASVYLTKKAEIELAEKIESFIASTYEIGEALGVKIMPWKLLQLLPVLRMIDGKPMINHLRFKKLLEKK